MGLFIWAKWRKMANKTIPHEQDRITAIIRFNLIANPIKTHFQPFLAVKSFNLIFTMIWALFFNIKSENFLIFSKQFVSVSEKYLIFVSLDGPLMVCLLKWLILCHFLWHCNSAGMWNLARLVGIDGLICSNNFASN